MIGGWDGLEEFVAVAGAGSFTAGAKAFGASVTHMSRAVARLESRLQTQLFNRTTRSVHLTETGRIFLERCQRLVDEREDAIAGIAAQGQPSGSLRVTCSYALGERFVAPLVREFAQEHPALWVTLDLDNDVVDIISRGFDLAVRTGHLEDSRLIATRVAQRELVTVASRHYLSLRGQPRDIADLAGHDCLLGSASHWHFRRGQSYRPQGRWQCNSGATVVDACLAGMGVCQLPAFYVRDHLAAGRLQEVLADERPEDEPIWAVYPTRRHLSPKVSGLVAILRAQLQGRLDEAKAQFA
ncbi:LysR family transcriptional regulator [Croceicoccus sp. BE223]|uniref:LysR family transcriptional regulator n=1 Tax=Croceicoccus sp. BE223 TaxID=2817716 RepID=UPI00286623D8|nr:LysR family transcriptional regulator [Croceicoccus sp. BE223]MDR7103071.1 DNA-binding transcriptional LysR family regulator [Croceicoccus sp. BE223]